MTQPVDGPAELRVPSSDVLDLRNRFRASDDAVQKGVCLAQDRVTGLTCVLKLARAKSDDAAALEREGRLLVDLEHPRLVSLTDRFVAVPGFDGAPTTGLATRWVDGPGLREAARELPIEGRLELFAGLLDAVGYLHRRGVLHLDLKPENVVVTEDGEPVLLDLGSARPLHAGPGEAGGTLGYAAPEVLLGEAPTAASDVYGLGAVLYELLAGRAPYGRIPAEATRRVMLAEDPPPLRLVAADVPRALAKVVDELLTRDPGGRPASVDEVRDRLGAAGVRITLTAQGAPGFVGREIELDALREALRAERRGLVAVIGPAGSGRSRMARRALAELSRRVLDLSRAPGLAEAAYRLLASVDAKIPARRRGWWQGYVPSGDALGGLAVFLGRRERADRTEVEEIDAVALLLERAGCLVVWAAEELVTTARCVPVAPLSRAELERMALDVGAVDGGPAVEAAHGRPGLLLEGLSVSEARLKALPAEIAAVHRGLSALPMPIPAAVVARLEPAVRHDVARLVTAGLARWEAGGALVVLGATRAPVDESWRARILPALRDGRVAAAWSAVVACRAGALDVAAELLPRADELLSPDARVEVLEALVAAGDRSLRLTLAEALIRRQRHDRAAEILDLPDATGPEVALRSRALRRGSQPAAAMAWLAERMSGLEDAGARCESAWVKLALGMREEAAADLELAKAIDPDHPWIRMATIDLEVARVESGGDPQGLLRAMSSLGADPSIEGLRNGALALSRLGRLEEATIAYQRALEVADQTGDVWQATATRQSLGLALRRLNRSAQARRVYDEALALACAHGNLKTMLRATYELCVLETLTDRLASAERHLAMFERTAAQVDEPQAGLRAAFLRAGIAEKREDPEAVIRAMEPISSPNREIMASRGMYLAAAHLASGRPDAAIAALDAQPLDTMNPRNVSVIRGRAHLALARAQLAQVQASIPEGEPDPAERRAVGEALLAAAGEDLDPESFGKRREMLARAAPLLRGQAAARAADLRDRLHDAPSTTLDSLADLAEAAADPQLFPKALARLVGEALGAHRVVIVLRLPGLGQRVTWRDLSSGEEAAGIVSDVTRRIRAPGDIWLAEDAFSDPKVREASTTVRDFGIKSVVAVAVPHGERVIGALYADDVVRAGRFGPREVEVLQRLARAVGRMVSLLPGVAAAGEDPFAEPEDVHGVVLVDPKQIHNVRGTIDLLRGQRESNLLVTGATGAGKTWFARRVATEILGTQGLIELVLRRTDADKMVAQLSGTRRGDFSGAVDAVGMIEKAIRERKALFLDEIQSLDEEGQQSLLPLLELPLRRFGGFLSESRRLNGPLHVILGTNVDVKGNAWSRHFREDLWWRMAQHHVHLPSLAERGPNVVFRYLERMLAQQGAGAPDEVFDLGALHTVTRHEWPGNLRMLEAFAQKAARLRATRDRPLAVGDLGPIGLGQEAPVRQVGLDDLTGQAVLRALHLTSWNQKEAARVLGISRYRLLRLLKSYRLLEEVRRRRDEEEAAQPEETKPTRGKGVR